MRIPRGFNLVKLLWLIAVTAIKAETIQVTVEQGILEGEVLTSFNGNSYSSFKGIPYAAPPIGDLRFAAPQPPLEWSGVRNATSHGSVCPQVDIFTGLSTAGSEDCLFLNVYSPDVNPDTALPVMVYIYGGGFKSGSGNDDFYGPSLLMDHGVVLVTFNYRLEVLGFLSLKNKDVPGNAGMKDQVAALKWVQNNIAKFGGDPDNVTIFGQSAGGAAVVYHVLSPLSKGLFQRAISMSSVPTCDYTTPFRSRDKAFVLGKQLGVTTSDETVLVNYLRNVSSEFLYNTNPALLTLQEALSTNILKMYYFVPDVEGDNDEDVFLPKSVEDLLDEGVINDVDIMIGYTDKEGVAIVDAYETSYMPNYDKYPEMVVPSKFLYKCNPDTILNISKTIRQQYFGNATINVDVISEFVDYVSDSSFIYDIERFTKSLAQISTKSIYKYRFSAVSDRNYYGNAGLKYGISGAGHQDDLLYLFEAKALNQTLDKDSGEYVLVQRQLTLYTNFAKYGNPTPDDSLGAVWPTYDIENESYMEIGTTLTVGAQAKKEAVEFWESVFETVGIQFYPVAIESETELIQVTVEEGILEGEMLKSFNDNSYASFKGIPYAAPPIGTLRFKAPQPPLQWSGIRRATEHGSICIQTDTGADGNVIGNEDCLFLNVYSPNLNPDTPLPVMFFIHGGGFESGSGNDDYYGPNFLMDHGVVLVTVNYRLEVLGFLSLQNDDAPGNAGMKDQVAALKWVKNNIAKFGGDPDNVTIFGQSAGGAAVAYHILSPLSNGLFQRAISMSSVPTCDYATPFRSRDKAFVLGKQLGITTEDATLLINYLRNVSSDQLHNVNVALMTFQNVLKVNKNVFKMYYFVPDVEENNDEDVFLSKSVEEIMSEGIINDVDIMIGHTDKEGLLEIDEYEVSYLPIYNRYPEMLVPTKILYKFGAETILNISGTIQQHFFGNKTVIDKSELNGFVEYISESSFTYDINRFAKALANVTSKSIYKYKFSAVSGRNYYGNQGLKYGISGAAHQDDLLYLFEAKALNQTLVKDSGEYVLVQRMCALFTNFAKYGNPTPDDSLGASWPQYNVENESYMEIGNSLIAGSQLLQESSEFWESVFEYANVNGCSSC